MKENTKSQPITKEQVWLAYQEVRKHGKSAGVDGITLKAYEQIKGQELYKIWNRMASGSYFPPPVKRVVIPKPDGKPRNLGLPTIGDKVAQTVVKHHLEPVLEPCFHKSSYGYRPKRSAHDALQQATEQCGKQPWILDLDIQGFFDHLDHELIMTALQRHTTEKWVLMYVERWLKAPIQQEDGSLHYPKEGSPQGGVISPLISNLYLHYAFDKWMEKQHKEIVFERFADDIIVHCMSQEKAESLLTEIRARLEACGLTLHPIKTKIVYCKTTNRKKQYQQVTFDFLGMSFKPKVAKNRKSGVLFTTYGPAAISKKSVRKIIDTIKSKYLTKRVTVELKQLAPLLAPHVRGWINYFGKVNLRLLYKVMKYLNGQLLKWTMKRFKRFRGRIKAARNWLKKMCKENPNMFVHWQYGFYP